MTAARLILVVFVLTISVVSTASAQVTSRVSVGSGGVQANAASSTPLISADGRYVAFTSSATNLTADGTPGAFWHDRVAGLTRFIASGRATDISGDGQFVVFDSISSTLVPNDTNGTADIFVWSASDGSRQRVSIINGSQFGGTDGRITRDGRYVGYAVAVGGSSPQTVIFDRVTQTSSILGAPTPNGPIAISGDARYIAFTHTSDELPGDTNGKFDVYLTDRQSGSTVLVSTTAGGAPGTGDSELFGMSDDARYILLASWSPNFPGARAASPITWDLFIKDLQTGALTQVNVNGTGQRYNTVFFAAGIDPTISRNGRWVVFTTPLSNVVAGDTNGLWDTFLYDRTTATTIRVSVPVGGGEAAGGRSDSGIASDAGFVAFTSSTHNLVPGDTNFEPDVFVHEPQATPACAVTFSPAGLAVVANAGRSGTITVTAASSCSWTATVNAPWIHLTGASSGVGNGTVSYSVDPYFGSTTRSGAIAANTTAYGLRQLGTITQPPFGVWETPSGPSTPNVTGAVPFTGWALDDVQVRAIRVYRDPVEGEGPGQVFIGNAVQVAGARPDVATANPSYPYNTQAGWGLMVLTNMLPNQGNGTFTFYVYVDDADGHTRQVGTPRTLICTNATATAPFGTIDTPAQGEVVSGIVTNFGWALTPQPAMIPTDGSTINVFIDGVNVGHPTYNQNRSDIATLFPGYANANGAVGYFIFDSHAYADGVHTIAWTVTDSLGAASGIGSRYFTIQNGTAPTTPPFLRRDESASAAQSLQAILQVNGDRGRWVMPGEDGAYSVSVRDLGRIELQLDPWHSRGSCARFSTRELPPGASLNAETGVLAWQPAAGAGGVQTIEVIRTSCGGAEEAIAIRVVFDLR